MRIAFYPDHELEVFDSSGVPISFPTKELCEQYELLAQTVMAEEAEYKRKYKDWQDSRRYLESWVLENCLKHSV